MTLEQTVKQYLEGNSRARERRFRYEAVWNIMQIRLGHFEVIDKKFFINEAFVASDSINRLINHVQKNYPELRGNDYPDKTKLQQEKMKELGYEPGYYDNELERIKKEALEDYEKNLKEFESW